MNKLTLLAGLLYACLFLQDVTAQNCIAPTTLSCIANLNDVSVSAGKDKAKLCSVTKSYFECLKKRLNNCKLNPPNDPLFLQIITTAQMTLDKHGCVSGGSGTVYSIMVIIVGVCLHRLI